MDEKTVIVTEGDPAGYPPQGWAPAPAAPAYDRTQQAITVLCPVCQTPNSPGEVYCQDCGLHLASGVGSADDLPDLSQVPRLVDTGGAGGEHSLTEGANLVGRESGEVLLAHPTVSRRHAQLTLIGGRVEIEDLGSSNGTSHNGRKLVPGEKATLRSGDMLKFGNLFFTFMDPAGSSAPAVADPAADAEDGEIVAAMIGGDAAYGLRLGVNSIGRQPNNQVFVNDSFMSGRHAEIRINADGSAELVDVGSTNGSFIAGRRLPPNEPQTLYDGLEFRLGKTDFTYQTAPALDSGTCAENMDTVSFATAPIPQDADESRPLDL